MPLLRYVEYKIWENHAASAGEISPEQDVSKLDRITVYVTVSAATTITLQVQVFDTWIDRDSLTFSGAGTDEFEIWASTPKKVRFKTSSAVTISIYVTGKC
jgi:hypothetical protein